MSSTKFAAMALAFALSSSAICQSPPVPDLAVSKPRVSGLFASPTFRSLYSTPDRFTSSSVESGSSSNDPDSLEDSGGFPLLHKKKPLEEKNKPIEEATPIPEPAPKKVSKNKDKLKVHPFSTVAFGVRAGSLGAGAEIATPLTRTLNLRASANYMSFRYSFRIDGINYYTRADFRSGQVGIDWFPFHGGFHISPGYMYFNTGLAGAAKVSPGQSFVLDKTTYINSVDDPVGGTASITYSRHYAPVLTLGFTNIIPRTGGHFSMPFEIGAAYTHAPVMAVQLDGTACTNQGCFNAGNDPDTQANLKREVQQLNESISKVPVFPIATLGIAVRF